MLNSPGRAAGWLSVALLGLSLAGCLVQKTKITVHGKVTYNNKPVDNGYVMFSPEGSTGLPVSGSLKGGEYTVENVTIGKNRVEVVSSDLEPQVSDNPTHSRDAANAERLSRMKTRQPAQKPTVPRNATGNNQVWDIGSGQTELDLELQGKK